MVTKFGSCVGCGRIRPALPTTKSASAAHLRIRQRRQKCECDQHRHRNRRGGTTAQSASSRSSSHSVRSPSCHTVRYPARGKTDSSLNSVAKRAGLSSSINDLPPICGINVGNYQRGHSHDKADLKLIPSVLTRMLDPAAAEVRVGGSRLWVGLVVLALGAPSKKTPALFLNKLHYAGSSRSISTGRKGT